MVLLDNLPKQLKATDPEDKRIISGVSWEQYDAFLSQLGDSPWYRVTYIDGLLEIMAPSRRHETYKTIIGSLLEDYFKETRTRYFPLGSTTLRQEKNLGGTESDESYCIGTEKEFPDLAIEVVVTSGGIDKLEVYKRLGVREVWFFKNNQFEVYHLRGEAYEHIEKSELLPDLDLGMLGKYATASDPLEAALEFRDKLREARG